MRFTKPLLAGAALLTLAAPALASAQSFDRGFDHRDGGYEQRRGDDGFRNREFAQRDYGYRGGYRTFGSDYDHGDYRYSFGYRHHHHHWWEHRWDSRGW